MSRAQPDDTAADAVAAWRAAERRAAATTSRDADGGAAAPRPELEVDADGSAPLRERFAALLASLPTRGDGGGDGDSERLAECTRKWWRILHDKHCAAGRHYHTLEHLRNYHAQLRRYKAAGRLAAPAVCELALFFHDAVYDARRADNELQSAQLFADFCADLRRATDLPPSLHLEQATGLILRTANHMDATPAEDSDAAAFLDCDLHTLGATPRACAWSTLTSMRPNTAAGGPRCCAPSPRPMSISTSRRRCVTSARPWRTPISRRRSGFCKRRLTKPGLSNSCKPSYGVNFEG